MGRESRRVRPPSKLLLLIEGRAMGELATTLLLRPQLRGCVRGDGHPVLLLPGFMASDFSTRPLRLFLRELGYSAHRWALGRNLGPVGDLEHRMENRLMELFERHERAVSLIGWSLGGVYARILANRFPAQVRCVISLGSPITGDPEATNSARLFEFVTRQKIADIDPERLADVRRTPPVPTTSIFSRTDGVTSWRACIEPEGPLAESVEVPGSHLGLGFNRRVLFVIADRLAQPSGGWQPFFRDGFEPPPRIHRPREARTGAS